MVFFGGMATSERRERDQKKTTFEQATTELCGHMCLRRDEQKVNGFSAVLAEVQRSLYPKRIMVFGISKHISSKLVTRAKALTSR
jgi:hypothetical protein